MKICFPVKEAQGLESTLYDHFGSARQFIVVDSESNQVTTILASHEGDHRHGACSPLRALGGYAVDAVVTRRIGGGALAKLHQAGITVLTAQADSVWQNLELLKNGTFDRSRIPSCGNHHTHQHGTHQCHH